jgi:hypothetical protein
MCFFSTTFVPDISHAKKKSAKYDKKCVLVFTHSSRYSCQILTKLQISRQIFEKYSNIKFHENPSSGSRAVPCGQTDMANLTVAFRNIPNALKRATCLRPSVTQYWRVNSLTHCQETRYRRSLHKLERVSSFVKSCTVKLIFTHEIYSHFPPFGQICIKFRKGDVRSRLYELIPAVSSTFRCTRWAHNTVGYCHDNRRKSECICTHVRRNCMAI